MPPLHVLDAQPQVPSEPHLLAQLPQALGSLAVIASQPLPPFLSQSSVPAPQLVHTPVLQYSLEPQTVVHDPHLSWLVLRLLSQPFPGIPSQSPYPEGHAEMHVPPTQLGVASGHTRPQVLQLSGSDDRLTSQPSTRGFELQSAKPPLQAIRQLPPLQEGAPLLVLQAEPQPPQLETELLMFVSQPSPSRPLQLP